MISKFCAEAPSGRPRFATLGLIYAIAAAIGTIAFFAFFIIFLGNFPKTSQPWLVPSADVGPGIAPLLSLILNFALVAVFSLQHSVMARPAVKGLISKIVPPALERATYVHAANLTGFLIIILWQPVPIVLWDIENDAFETLLWLGFAGGWLLLFAAAIAIDIFELLGLSQAWHWSRGRKPPALMLKTKFLYRVVEHPMYVGVMLGVWMTPYMTLGHAALAMQLSLYIAIATAYERRDLQTRFGAKYYLWRLGHSNLGRPARAPPAIVATIAAELSQRFQPIVAEPLPYRISQLLARL